jgi:hypothetical protein
VAPKLMADASAFPMLAGGVIETMDQAVSLKDVSVRRMGDDVMIAGAVHWPERVH